MNEEKREEIVREYLRLEEAFLDLIQYVPLVGNLDDARYDIASPRTAEFGLDCCTWIETLFRELLSDPRWDDVTGVDEARRHPSPNIETYRSVFGERLGFDQGGYLLKWVEGPEIRPFEEWAKGENPEWFKVYSKYKHNRFEFAHRFTLGHALKSFVALVILVNHWPSFGPGLRKDLERRPSRVLRGV